MVAYSFKSSFVSEIRSGVKRQTIRLPRKRHARPGEWVQLYSGMRTRSCEKIIPDPLCVGVDEVRIDLRRFSDGHVTCPSLLDGVLQVNGIPVAGAEADAYARGDGFAGLRLNGLSPVTPFQHMVRWWILVHGHRVFDGVAIRWEAQP